MSDDERYAAPRWERALDRAFVGFVCGAVLLLVVIVALGTGTLPW